MEVPTGGLTSALGFPYLSALGMKFEEVKFGFQLSWTQKVARYSQEISTSVIRHLWNGHDRVEQDEDLPITFIRTSKAVGGLCPTIYNFPRCSEVTNVPHHRDDLVTGASSCLGSSKLLGETFLPSFSIVFGEKEVLLGDPPPQASANCACRHIHGFDS